MATVERGILTDEIQELSYEVLGREICQDELRLFPYIDYCIKNGGKFNPRRLNSIEQTYLENYFELGFLNVEKFYRPEFIDFTLSITKEFYDFMQEVLYLSYAEHKIESEGGRHE